MLFLTRIMYFLPKTFYFLTCFTIVFFSIFLFHVLYNINHFLNIFPLVYYFIKEQVFNSILLIFHLSIKKIMYVYFFFIKNWIKFLLNKKKKKMESNLTQETKKISSDSCIIESCKQIRVLFFMLFSCFSGSYLLYQLNFGDKNNLQSRLLLECI